MPLYRAVYIRDGKPRGMTFWETCPPLAAEFAYLTLQKYVTAAGGGDILTVAPVLPRREPRTAWVAKPVIETTHPAIPTRHGRIVC